MPFKKITFSYFGKNYTLPRDQIEAAYRYQDLEYRKEDVRGMFAQGEYDNIKDLSDEDCKYIAERADNILSKNDLYWSCYWDAFEAALEEFNEGKCMG